MSDALIHGLDEIRPLLHGREQRGEPLGICGADGRTLDAALVAAWDDRLSAAGVGHGDRLLVLAEPDAATVATMVAAWHRGSTVCPLPPETAPDVLARIAADCGARQAVSATRDAWSQFDPPQFAPPAPPRPGGHAGPRLDFRTPPRVTGVDLALLIYTSGSTGAPKGIMLSHGNVLAALRAIACYLALRSDDVILSIPPLHFDYGLYQVLLGIQTGCRVALTPPSTNPMQALRAIRDIQPTVLPIVPALGAGIAKLALAFKQTHPSVRLITNTGGHLPPAVIADLRRVFPHAAVMPMYGLSESKRALFMAPDLVDARPGSVGGPMPGLDAKVMVAADLQADGAPAAWREAAPHEVGMLFVRGASVMQGYTAGGHGAGAQLLAGAYRDDNWLITGDLFSVDEDGFFYFRGRAKELIKQGGFCLYPRDLEALMERHPGVAECAVVGVTTPAADEMACMFVLCRQPVPREALQAWLGQQLDAHYLPRRIDVVDAWPMNQNGKIDRKALVQRIAAAL